MSIITVTVRLTHKYLMGKTKSELSDWILQDNKSMTQLHEGVLRYGHHVEGCFSSGRDCTCGYDDAKRAAREWLGFKT